MLVGGRAEALLADAVADAGGELLGWRVRQVDHRPGSGATVAYTVRVRWADREQDEVLVASTAPMERWAGPATMVRLPGGGTDRTEAGRTDRAGAADTEAADTADATQAAVWRYPHDPGLPALATACDPAVAADLLTRFVAPTEAGQVGLRTIAYRPRRRAVVEVSAPGGRLFLKVVRPPVVAELNDRHRLLRDAGLPVAPSLGWTDDGLIVLRALPGVPMREVMLGRGVVPSGRELVRLVAQLPDDVLTLRRRSSWSDGAAHYAGMIAAALPDQAQRVQHFAAEVTAGLAGIPADEPCHGDLYESQVLLEHANITGLLDIDTVGPGRRADDLACLLAHCQVLELSYPSAAPRLARIGADWRAAAFGAVDPQELQLRAAGVLLSLATGPFRVQERAWQASTLRRLDLVEAWLELRTDVLA